MQKSAIYVRASTIKKLVVNTETEVNVTVSPATPEKKNFFGKVVRHSRPITYNFHWSTSESPNGLIKAVKSNGIDIRYDEAEKKFYRLPYLSVEFYENEYENITFDTDAEALTFGKEFARANGLTCITK